MNMRQQTRPLSKQPESNGWVGQVGAQRKVAGRMQLKAKRDKEALVGERKTCSQKSSVLATRSLTSLPLDI